MRFQINLNKFRINYEIIFPNCRIISLLKNKNKCERFKLTYVEPEQNIPQFKNNFIRYFKIIFSSLSIK